MDKKGIKGNQITFKLREFRMNVMAESDLGAILFRANSGLAEPKIASVVGDVSSVGNP